MALGKMESGSEREFVIEVACSPLREMAPQGTNKGAKASAPLRFLARQGSKGLRQRRGPALVGADPAVNLTEEQANRIKLALAAEARRLDLTPLRSKGYV
jgi:hypothetical protein